MLLQLCPAPRSQGCEVARVLPKLDTAIPNKFPLLEHETGGLRLLRKQHSAIG
jgi:hypothetical protein